MKEKESNFEAAIRRYNEHWETIAREYLKMHHKMFRIRYVAGPGAGLYIRLKVKFLNWYENLFI